MRGQGEGTGGAMGDGGAGGAEHSRFTVTEEHFHLLVDSVKDYAIFMLDPAGHVASWNAGAREIKGYAPEEIVGKHISVFYSPEDRDARKAQKLLEIASRDGRVEDEGWRVRKDGSRFWADVVITALREPAGRLVGFAKVTRDLTARRTVEERLRETEARLRLMIASVRDYAIFMLDPNGKVVTWNAGAEEIEGYRAEEIIGQHFSRFFPPEAIAAGKPRQELDVAAAEGRFEDEAWRVRKDGSRFWASVVISAVHDDAGRLIGFTKVTRDLTERRHLEDGRLRLAQAQEALRLRDQFLSIASHELKTPLTALHLQLQALHDRKDFLDERTARKIERAYRATDRLVALVESLLDVSRIATGKLSLEYASFDLVESAREVVEQLHEAALNAGCDVSLEAQGPVAGSWDRLRIEQVLTNLLWNALNYAVGAPVQVTIRRESDTAVLRVCDGGPGIPEQDLLRVFGRFERGSAPGYGGLGLGLYVARQITEAHGGTIIAANRAEGGACFTVLLPFLRPNHSVPSPSASSN
jgi:PAS domain S-box-containing protein